MLPRISIIIPCYNHGKYIREAIESVEQCTDKNLYEIIIINDGSTEAVTIEELQKLSLEGYHIINQNNLGLGAARNNAIRLAKGEYILPLDSDNLIFKEYIYDSIKILDEKKDVSMVYGNSEYFGEKSGVHHVGDFNLQKMMIGNYIDACAVYRKSTWVDLGGYDEKMPVMGMEDWDFWLNMIFHGYEFLYVPKTLFKYRVLSNSMHSAIHSNNSVQIENYIQKKYKKYLNRNHINEVLINAGKQNKKLAMKFFLKLYFPGILNFLVKNKILKSGEIF
jgi:glycosyltransferase involved in cell wall biosynthesis